MTDARTIIANAMGHNLAEWRDNPDFLDDGEFESSADAALRELALAGFEVCAVAAVEAPDPTERRVDVVAQYLADNVITFEGGPNYWDGLPDRAKDDIRTEARAVLAVLDGVGGSITPTEDTERALERVRADDALNWHGLRANPIPADQEDTNE